MAGSERNLPTLSDLAVIDLDTALGATAAAVNGKLDELLPVPAGGHARVHAAMRHATLAGGKRLRPFLVVATGDLFGVPRARSLNVGAAIELVHTYSLVHDDLPCMDDDDLRRGLPTVHVAFDEATAVLAGDALLTLAFEVIARDTTHPDPAVRNELVLSLARRAGADGMVGGQMIDLLAERQRLGMDEVIRLQAMKTGALFGFCCEAGAVLGGAPAEARQALLAYAADLGLAFQIADDLLDAEGDASETGKAVGKDADAGKATFLSLLGVDGARKKAQDLVADAEARLDLFGEKAHLLRGLARFVINRKS